VAIEVKSFSKKYGSFTAVKDIDITIESGEIVGFVGKNGAGKSTTMRAMVNVLFPTAGEIVIDGMDSVQDAKKLKRTISYMSSDAEFYRGTKVIDLFKLCIGFSGEGIEKVESLAKYFELDVNKKVDELSLGNRKKVSIIQALLKQSDVFIMDEPTNGLDPLMQEKFFDKVLDLQKKGATIFLSSHNLSEIEKYCNKVVFIKDGVIVDVLDMSEVHKNSKQIVTATDREGNTTTIDFAGDINVLIKELGNYDLASLEIRKKTVEEEFIKYYMDGDEDE
jgi:ABC-2 type transport system ATP-binding protein